MPLGLFPRCVTAIRRAAQNCSRARSSSTVALIAMHHGRQIFMFFTRVRGATSRGLSSSKRFPPPETSQFTMPDLKTSYELSLATEMAPVVEKVGEMEEAEKLDAEVTETSGEGVDETAEDLEHVEMENAVVSQPTT